MVSPPDQNVLIVHPLPVCRLGLRHVITLDSELRVCGEAETLVRARSICASRKPHLVIVDPEMEEDGGFLFIQEIHRQQTEMRCVVFGGRMGRAKIERAIKLSALAIISHFDSGTAILQALYSASKGIKHMTPCVAEDFCQQIDEAEPEPPSSLELSSVIRSIHTLSLREKEIFRLIGKGLAVKEVAAQAGISARTVESHLVNIKQKLQLRTNSELRRQAILFGTERSSFAL